MAFDGLYHLTIPCIIFLSIILFKLASTPPADPYGLFHLSLNRLPGQNPDESPDTEWLNMGYWKGAGSFPEACKALALKTFRAARLTKQGRVLDVGHGTGQSLILLLSESSIERPNELVGITSLGLHHQRSLHRVEKYQARNESDCTVDLYHGDAVYDGKDAKHPLSPSCAKEFDSILALDCAYHFNTRRRFLEQSYHKLAVGGSIALADICFLPSTPQKNRIRSWTRWTLRGLMHAHNMVSTEEYVAQMQEIGYKEVIMEDISSDVFPGFIQFLKSKGGGWWFFAWFIRWYYSEYVGARFVVVSGRK
ncbi:hypothetical protein CPC08DRAFT_2626 [Agrocybe pediades]|nr:hypothetical protein CPC08DRAFT_2626 [Agrocybe pediades]